MPRSLHLADFDGTAPSTAAPATTADTDSADTDSAGASTDSWNAAVHLVTIYQSGHPGAGRDFYANKWAESKSP